MAKNYGPARLKKVKLAIIQAIGPALATIDQKTADNPEYKPNLGQFAKVFGERLPQSTRRDANCMTPEVRFRRALQTVLDFDNSGNRGAKFTRLSETEAGQVDVTKRRIRKVFGFLTLGKRQQENRNRFWVVKRIAEEIGDKTPTPELLEELATKYAENLPHSDSQIENNASPVAVLAAAVNSLINANSAKKSKDHGIFAEVESLTDNWPIFVSGSEAVDTTLSDIDSTLADILTDLDISSL